MSRKKKAILILAALCLVLLAAIPAIHTWNVQRSYYPMGGEVTVIEKFETKDGFFITIKEGGASQAEFDLSCTQEQYNAVEVGDQAYCERYESIRTYTGTVHKIEPLAEDTTQSDTISPEEQAQFLARMQEVYAPAMDHFGLNDTDYTCMVGVGSGTQEVLTTEEYLGLNQHIVQEGGDTVPLFFWEEDAQTIHTLDLDKDGTFTHRTFQRAEEPDLTDSDFRNLWLETTEAETWTAE